MNENIKIYDTDLLVFGAGPSGIAAAIAAAKEGQETYLIEINNKIGGVMASSPGMMLGAGYPMKKSIGGFFEDFVQRMYNHRPPLAQRRLCSLENFGEEVVYDPDYATTILYEMLEEAGVKLLLNHIASKVLLENHIIKGVEVVNSQRTILLRAKTYIDCTGDGDIANMAGVPSQLGDEKGRMMGASLTFFMEKVDWQKAFKDSSDPYFTSYAKEGIREGKIHKSLAQIYMVKGFREGSVYFNTVTVADLDGLEIDSIVEASNIARKRVYELGEFFQSKVAGFEKSYISNIGPLVGIRETRKLEGMHTLTYQEISQGKKFEDGIVACDNPLDEVFRHEKNPFNSHLAALEGDYYTIPFRSLIPKEVKNLLFAGRNISADAKAFSSVRGMPQCMIMGQSVGIGASIANQEEIPVQKIDSKKVVKRLVELGVRGIGGEKL